MFFGKKINFMKKLMNLFADVVYFLYFCSAKANHKMMLLSGKVN